MAGLAASDPGDNEMSLPELILLTNAATTWLMCGVIWFVQLVHYPLFNRYSLEDYSGTMVAHQNRTGWVVFAPMLVELSTAVALLFIHPVRVPVWQVWVGVGLVVIWAVSTAAVQIPAHECLANAFDPVVHRWLVRSNWLRTAAWSLRGVLVLWMLAGQ